MPSPVKQYQSRVHDLLEEYFNAPDVEVTSEWSAMQFNPTIYSPRLDVAVGPFSITRGENQIYRYNQLFDAHLDFFHRCIRYHEENLSQYSQPGEFQLDRPPTRLSMHSLRSFNRNARCFLAIEIENQVSRKHLLGGTVNACALARVGIMVGWSPEKVRSLVKLQRYWEFLEYVDKNTFQTGNLIILSPHQLVECLNELVAA